MDELTEDRLRFLIGLAGEIVQQGKAFKVFPPAEVTEDPGLLDRDDAAPRLVATKWWVRFADGSELLLSFPELMILTHSLISMLTHKGSSAASVPNLTNPEAVRFLLGKLDLEGVPRERFVPTFPLYGVHHGEAGGRLQLQGSSDPNTGLDVIFLFTDRPLADRFAAQLPGGRAVELAGGVGELKALLRPMDAQAVAFDPVYANGRFQARHTLLVPAILCM